MKTFYRILHYIKPYWKHLSFSMACTVLYALLNGVSVYLTIPLLDTLFKESAGNTQQTENIITDASSLSEQSPDWFNEFSRSISDTFKELILSGTTSEKLIKICLLIIFAFLGKNLFGYMQSYYLAFVEQGVLKDIRNAAYRHLHELPMSYFKQEKTGNLISRITNDVNVILSSISAVFLNLLREPVTIIVFLGIAISISWRLTVFSVLVLPFSLIIISKIGQIIRKSSTDIQKKMAEITTLLHETITGVKIVKAFGMEEYENKKFEKETEGFFKLTLRMTRIRNAASPLTEFLSVVVGAVIIYYGGLLVLEEGTLKASEFLGFLFAIFQLMTPVKELSTVYNRVQESSAAGDRIFEILDTAPSIQDPKNPKSLSEFKGDILFKNVFFHYADSPELVLKNINFSVQKGKILAIVGSSGAGKSTLVDLIPRFFDPVDGAIFIDDVNIKDISLFELRRLMGIVTQETVLFNESVLNNIAYGLSEYPTEKIEEAAKAANAHQFIMELPKGYDTIIGEKGTKLSGGQRQRLSIARAILKNPPIMILDEATSSLDNESEVLVQQAIERLMRDRTSFVIAHRLSTIRNADRIIVLHEGEIVQDGRHEELLSDEMGIYKKLYDLQFGYLNGEY